MDRHINRDWLWPGSKIHITVPSSRRPAQHRPIQGVIVHRCARIHPQRLPQWELPRTRIEDTVFDLVAAATTFDGAYSWISRALSKELVTVDMLREAMAERGRVRWRGWLTEALAEGGEGVARTAPSVPQARLRHRGCRLGEQQVDVAELVP
jgi:hypothetical protein